MDCMYYTDGIISNKKSFTKMCVLFDSVGTFQLSPAYYIDELEKRFKDQTKGFSHLIENEMITRLRQKDFYEFVRNNCELINAGILKPIVLNQNPGDFKPGQLYGSEELNNKTAFSTLFMFGQNTGVLPKGKGHLDSVWYTFNHFNGMYAALHFSIREGLAPISDNYLLSKLACATLESINPITYIPTLEEKSANIAFQTMSLLLPDFPPLNPQEILEVRDSLKDELGYFKSEMRMIAKGITEEEYGEIDSLVNEKVKPRLEDIKLKSKSIKGELFRKISSMFFVGSGATTLLTHFLNLPPSGQYVTAASFLGKALLNVHEYQSKKQELRESSENRGIVFLLDIDKKYKKR